MTIAEMTFLTWRLGIPMTFVRPRDFPRGGNGDKARSDISGPGLSGAMGPTEEIHKGIVENALEPRIRLHDSTGQHNHQMSTTRCAAAVEVPAQENERKPTLTSVRPVASIQDRFLPGNREKDFKL